MNQKRVAPTIMFWLGVFYMTAVICAMTPYTYSLDDIKVTLIHVLGPALIIAYLILVGSGQLEIPRRGALYPLAIYAAVMIISALLSRRYCQWQSWLGVGMFFVLLGPFLAFFSCSTSGRRLESVLRYFTFLLLLSTVFGLAIRGREVETVENGQTVRTRRGLGYFFRAPRDEKMRELQEGREKILRQFQALKAGMEGGKSETERAGFAARVKELHESEAVLINQIQKIRTSPLYRLAQTFDGVGGKTWIMSFVLNRQFYGAFLLLMIPMAIAVFLNSGAWFPRLLTARSSRERRRVLLSRDLFWQITAALAAATGLVAIRYTGCKITLFLGLETVFAAFVILYFFVARLPVRRRPEVLAAGGGLALLAISLFLLVKGNALLNHLRPGVFENTIRQIWQPIISRQIISGGGLGIWFDSVKNFFFGGGPTTFGILFPYFRRPDYFLYEISHRTLSAHNMFVDRLADTGLAGFASFTTFLGFLFWKSFKEMRQDLDARQRVMAVGVTAGMAGFLVHNANSPNSQWPIGAIQLWAGLGVMAGMVNRPRQKNGDRAAWRPPTSAQRRAAWVLCGLSAVGWLLTSIYGVQYFRSAVVNSTGLTYVGDDANPIANSYMQAIERLRQAMADPKRSPEERRQMEEKITALRDEYEGIRQEGMAAFQESIRLDPFFTTSYYKLATLEYLGRRLEPSREDFEKALARYKQLQAYCPEYSQIRLNLGHTYLHLGDKEEALKQYRFAAAMTIDLITNKIFIQQLWEAAQRRKSPLFSAHDLKDVDALAAKLRRTKDPFSQYLRAHLSDATRRLVDASGGKSSEFQRNILKTALAEDLNTIIKDVEMYQPDFFLTMPYSAVVSQRILEPESEIRTLRLSRSLLADFYPAEIAVDPSDEAVLICERLVDAWEEIHKKNKPIDNNVKLKLDDVRQELAVYYIAAAQKSGTQRQKMRALEYAHSLDPDNPKCLDELAAFYAASGEYETLRIFIRGALEKDPANPGLWGWLARRELLQGNLREAKRVVLILQKIAPGADDIEYLLFKIYERGGNAQEAIAHAKRYKEIGTNPKGLGQADALLKAYSSGP